METNLSLHILSRVVGELDENNSDFCRLAHWRKENNIPNSTFHRHLSSLKDMGFIERVGRDKYRLSGFFVSQVIGGSYQMVLEARGA